MTVEEKTKAYDKALERAKKEWLNNLDGAYKNYRERLEFIFPELKNNKKEWIEKIRQELKSYLEHRKIEQISESDAIDQWIVWIEKQGEQNPYSGVSFKYNDHAWGMCARDGGVEILIDRNLKAFISLDKSFIYPISSQSAVETAKEEKIDNQTCVKPADKFKPKFKPGDWITDGCLHCKIIEVLDECYIVDSKFGKTSITFKREYNYHLWSIQDARDGDILAGSKDNVILIFRGIGNTEWNDVIDYHCYYDCIREKFIVQKELEFWGNVEDNQLRPATKEQRDLLFKKMKESGYEFDFETKELKKIDTYCQENCKGFQETGKCFCDGECKAKKEHNKQNLQNNNFPQIEQKSTTWNKNDDYNVQCLTAKVTYDIQKGNIGRNQELIEWLKSLKDRIQHQIQSPQDWSNPLIDWSNPLNTK